MINMAVDVGFGRVKGAASNNRRVNFPSVVGEFRPVRFTSGMEGNDPIEHLAIEYNKKRWFVGESALKQSTPQATVDMERTVSEEGITLLLGAMANLVEQTPQRLNLVVGLPVMHYGKLKQKYYDAVYDTHFVDILKPSGALLARAILIVEGVKVLPQPLGTLFHVLLNERGELTDTRLATGKIGIIDIGYNTLDLARADSLEFIDPRSTSFSGIGMFSAFQALSNELYKNLGVEIPPERLEPLIRDGEVKIAGRRVEIGEYKKAAFWAASDQILSRVKSVWPDRWELDRILITGGGAVLLGEYLAAEFKQQAQIVSSPVFANVSGYLKFAARAWRQ